MPTAQGINSIGGELGFIPFCTNPPLVQATGQVDKTLTNGTFSFRPMNGVGTPYTFITNPVHFEQAWCEMHSANNGNTLYSGAQWNDIAIIPVKGKNDTDIKYGLAIQLGLWAFNQNNPAMLDYGCKAELRRLSDNFVIQRFPSNNNPNGAQMRATAQDGIVLSLTYGEWVLPGDLLPHQFLAFNLATNNVDGTGYFFYTPGISFDLTEPTAWLTAGYTIPDIFDYDPNDKGGNSGEGGGGGDHDPSSDKIEDGDIDDLNNISASNCGFVTLYKASLSQLQSIAEEMYSTNVWDIVKNWWNKPIEMIAGLMLLPVTPAGGATYRPKIGTHTFTAALQIVAKQYKEVDCGNIYVGEYYGSALDFSPYSKIQLYLPMIGLKELDVDEVMGKWLYVKYRIDCYNGDCIAFVYIGDGVAGNATIRYTFSGNCGQQIPTSSADFSAVINSCVQFATTAVASVISAGAAGAAAGTAALNKGATIAETAMVAESAKATANTLAAESIGAAGVNAVMNGKPRVDRAGSIGGSLGHMGVLKPFIIRTIPRQSLPKGYNRYQGYPLNMSGTIGSFSGYTVIDSVKLQGIPGTDGEIAEIDNILKGGVIL